MTTTTLTLTEFLLARIAEDEAVAREASRAPWTVGALDIPRGVSVNCNMQDGGASWDFVAAWDFDGPDAENATTDAEHIARHDPARVLAECEAKRRIVELHTKLQEYQDECCSVLVGPFKFVDGPLEAGTDSLGELTIRKAFATQEVYGCETMMYLAAVYSDHPDYREEWRP